MRSRNIVETQDFCYNGCRNLDDRKRDGKPMNISYQPLWNTYMIANMGKGEHISMKTLLRICGALKCDITDVIELEINQDLSDKK